MSNNTEQQSATNSLKALDDVKNTDIDNNANNSDTTPETAPIVDCTTKITLADVLKKAYIKALLVVAILLITAGVTAVLAMHFNYKNNNAVSEVNTTVKAPITKLPTALVVSSTDEHISFKKDKYILNVGKTSKTELNYISPNGEKTEPPNITYTSNNIDIATVDSNGKIKGIKVGKTSIVAVSETGIYTTVPVIVTAPKSHKIEDVPMLSQGETYPSGCESVSSTMLLNYYGFDITTDEFIDEYLPMAILENNYKGELIAPDTYSAFIGSPYSEAALGCFPPVIKNAMNDYFQDKPYKAVDVTGSSMESLINNYIANDQPVLIWATMWMQDAFVTYEWKVVDAKEDSPYKNGDTYKWLANEHCMVLVGYDKDYYYLNDPLNYYTTTYSRSVFDDRYEQMGKCALIIEKTE